MESERFNGIVTRLFPRVRLADHGESA